MKFRAGFPPHWTAPLAVTGVGEETPSSAPARSSPLGEKVAERSEAG